MPIVLLTDFGTRDAYAGILHGVIAQIAPSALVIDLCHEVTPYDVEEAAFALFQAYSHFPEGSIFVTVVDPGVGGECRRVLVQTRKHFFVGPDNGYLSLVLSKEPVERAIHLTHEAYFLNQVSSTFHGRDIFAPVAAQLAEGIDPAEMGPELFDLKRLEGLEPRVSRDRIEGKILAIDRFGNAISNIPRDFVRAQWGDAAFSWSARGKTLRLRVDHYAEAPPRKPFMLYGSSGFLEAAMNQASAAKFFKLKKGDKVSLKKLA